MKTTLLLVDDNPANLAFLFDHLDDAGYDVVVKDNGIDAVEAAAQSPPDLILLDVRMPGMDGYETCRALKANEQSADAPVIFLSAYDDADDRLKGFEAGGVDFISKPIDIFEVSARIDTHIALARTRRELRALNAQLEETVAARTAQLEAEIGRRRRSETEKEELVRIVREQNTQLFRFTEHLLQSRPDVRLELARIVNRQLRDNVTAIAADLQLAGDSLGGAGALNEEQFGRLRAAQLRTLRLADHLRNLDYMTTALPGATPATLDVLTSREQEVLGLLADGLNSTEIGNRLEISDVTVRTYRTSIMRKLDIQHLAGLVKFALRHNLTRLD